MRTRWSARSGDAPARTGTAQRNGYRHRDLDTRVGTIDVAVPKLRTGTYFPQWLLERRKRAESALVTVVADCYLAGVSTRRMDKLVKTLGIDSLSQVAGLADGRRPRPAASRTSATARWAPAGPFTFVAADALTMKVREGGRVVNAVVLVATGVNGDGHREVLGMRVATSETGAAWNEFFADLVARGLAGVRLVTSDAHAGLRRGDRGEPARRVLAALPHPLRREPDERDCPRRMWPAVKAMLHSVYDQPDAAAVHAQFDRLIDYVERQAARRRASTSPPPARTSSRSPRSPRTCGPRSGPTTPPNGSTARSAAAPTPSGSSPTATRSSASSARSWPSRPTNGPKDAATSASRSSPAVA